MNDDIITIQSSATPPISSEQSKMSKVSTYTVEGRKFIVTPTFQEDGCESFDSILLRLMKADVQIQP